MCHDTRYLHDRLGEVPGTPVAEAGLHRGRDEAPVPRGVVGVIGGLCGRGGGERKERHQSHTPHTSLCA